MKKGSEGREEEKWKDKLDAAQAIGSSAFTWYCQADALYQTLFLEPIPFSALKGTVPEA